MKDQIKYSQTKRLKFISHSPFVLAFFFSLFSLFFSSVFPIQADNGKIANFSISPFLAKETLLPKQTTTIKFLIHNSTFDTEILMVDFENFKIANDSQGTPQYFKSQPTDSTAEYATSWFVPVPDTKIPPKSSIVVPIKISVPANATTGGHYAAALYSTKIQNTEGNNISISNKVAAPILITIPGDITDNLQIQSFSEQQQTYYYTSFNKNVCKWNDGCNIDFQTILHNSGNIYEDGEGVIEIYNMFGSKVATLPFNSGGTVVLPNNSRPYLTKVNIANLQDQKFGKYTAKITLAYTDKHILLTKKVVFYLVNWTPIIIGGIGIGMLLLLIIIIIILKKKGFSLNISVQAPKNKK